MSAPLVVNTADGTCWTRRTVTPSGLALYAPEGVCNCPEFVMATLSELAEHGIAGTADVLPVPVGPEPQPQSLPLKVVAELNDLRMRLAGMANPPREVYLALYEGAEPELFTTVEAARECCDDLAKSDAGENYWDWTVNESGIHVQFWTHPDDDRPLSDTSGTVTPIVVQGDDDLSELERLRREAESARVDGRRLIRAEQRRAELEAVLATHCKDDQAEIERLRTELAEVANEIARFGIYGAALPATKALVKRADELVTENAELRARIAGLESERHATNEALDDAVQALRERQAEREALVERLRAGQQWERGRKPELVSENTVSQPELREIFGIPPTAPWEGEPAKCRCDEPGADPYACEAEPEDCKGEFSELNPFGGGPVQGHDAKVSRTCGCGWRTSEWHVGDGSAEEELHGHVVRAHDGVSPQTGGVSC